MASSKVFLVCVLMSFCFLANVKAETKYRVCASQAKDSECQAVETDGSTVSCIKISDNVDCLLKIKQEQADFVLLTAEEIALASAIIPETLSVIASVRHKDRSYQEFAFQSVAVVKADYKGGLSGLAKGGLCHPGYGKGKEQLWSDRVLKYFEKKVVSGSQKCSSSSKSSAEDEAVALDGFFAAACRPGPWLLDPEEDQKLKRKFPRLCTLCTADGTSNCDGYRYFQPRANTASSANSHHSAMACLTTGKGTVAYLAYNHLLGFFNSNMTELSNYALLCENGTTVQFNDKSPPSAPPCAWMKQPWPAIVARTPIATDLLKDLKEYMPSDRSKLTSWVGNLDSILFKEDSDVLEYLPQPLTVSEYFTKGRPIPISESGCRKPVKWCTVSETEQSKCSWVRQAALTVGLQPEITCYQGSSHIDCLDQVRDKRADFVGIDTNLGYLARKFYGETAVVYMQTTRKLNSNVLALIKDFNGSDITRFENLRDKNACFPEYGGIAWAAFVRAGRDRRIISTTECDYANEVANLFSASCAPGARDPAHFPSKAADPERLCSGCRAWAPRGFNEQGVVGAVPPLLPVPDDQQCPADISNKYYGTTGALRCLNQPDSNVAFIEGQYLKEKAEALRLDPRQFRVLCRNGSLAYNTGFDVDENCALSVTIDGEVVARRDYSESLSLQLLIQELDTWFGYNAGTIALINFKIFSPFDEVKDLLFKDSTIGIATSTSENEYVQNYIELNQHTDDCSGATNLYSLSVFTGLILMYSLRLLLN